MARNFCLLAIFLVVVSRAGADLPDWDEPLGPLSGRNVYAAHLPWFSFPAEKASPLPKGNMKTRFGLYYINEFSTYPFDEDGEILDAQGRLSPNRQEELTAFDYESLILETGWDWQVSPDWRLAADWRLHFRYGGFLDDVIVWWHDVLGVANAGREYFYHDRSQWTIRDSTGESFGDSGFVVSPGDLDLRAVWSYYNAPKLDLALEGAIKLPLVPPKKGFGSGYPDAGAAMLVDWRPWTRWAFFVNAGIIVPIGPSGRLMGQIIPAVEFRVTRNLSFILQANVQSSPMIGESGEAFDHPLFGGTRMFSLPQTDVKFGVRGRSGRLGWQFFIEEDPLTWEGPDILVYFGGEWSMTPGNR